MKAVYIIAAIFTTPIIILNSIGGIISCIWLAILGQWGMLIAGIVLLLFGCKIIGLLLFPQLLLATPGVLLAQKGKYRWAVLFMALSHFYIGLLITAWCTFMCSLFIDVLPLHIFIPRIILAYIVATAPWVNLARGEGNVGSSAAASWICVLSAQLAFIILIIILLTATVNILFIFRYFLFFMMSASLFNTIVSGILMREQVVTKIQDSEYFETPVDELK